MELSEKLKQIRIENNLTQQELADALCLSRTVITKYERGYCVPNLDTLISISKYFETNILDEYKNKFKLILLSLKCIYPYLISIVLLLFSSLYLIFNIVNTNSAYGYNIYNDELKVENSESIVIVKNLYNTDDISTFSNYRIIYNLNGTKHIEYKLFIENIKINLYEQYHLLFLCKRDSKNLEGKVGDNNFTITHKPFIYPLKDYDESLPYDKQTGECKEILDYYIKLIDKVK